MSVSYWKKQTEKAQRATKFAWGQYFQVRNEQFDSQLGIYNETDLAHSVLNQMRDTRFISELYKKAKMAVECSICLELITAETLDTTPCGHNFHKDCLTKLKDSKEFTTDTVPCPRCRKELWCVKSVKSVKSK